MKILVEKAVIEQALEAIETSRGQWIHSVNATVCLDTITALREALAEQAEGAIVKTCPDGYGTITTEQAEQEPVAWMNDSAPMGVFARHKEGAENFGCTIPLYAAPVRTKDLTDDEINDVMVPNMSLFEFARAVIAADRERNR